MPLFQSFADVLHNLVDKVGFSDEEAEKAHAVIDTSSGPRTAEPEQTASDASQSPATVQAPPPLAVDPAGQPEQPEQVPADDTGTAAL